MFFKKPSLQPSTSLIEIAEDLALLKIEVKALKAHIENLEADLSKAKYKKIINKQEQETENINNPVILPHNGNTFKFN